MLDTLLTGGRVWSGAQLEPLDVGLANGRVERLLSPRSKAEARSVVDVSGMWLLPGFIDGHFHTRAPGHVEREDFDTGTRAAIAGGVTTVMEMPFAVPSVHSVGSFQRRRDYAATRAYSDFALWAVGGITDAAQIDRLAEEGVIGFKILLHPAPAGREHEFEGSSVSTTVELYEALERIAATSRPAAVHCEDGDLIDLLVGRLVNGHRLTPDSHLRSRPAFVEAVAVSKTLELAHAVGLHIHLPHISSARALDYIRLAKSRQQRVSVETCPHYLLFDEGAYDEVGPYAKINPPIRTSADREALRSAIADGTVDTVGSDHAPYTTEEKERGWTNIFDAPSGCPGVEFLGAAILDMVVRSSLTIERAMELLSLKPALTFGLAPRKGSLALGADADIVVFDPAGHWVVDMRKLHTRSHLSARLYDGYELKGRIDSVYLRGTLACSNGQIVSQAGSGRFVRPD